MLVLLADAEARLDTTRAGLFDRCMVRIRTSRLDRDLAAGASPDSTKALALRARALVRPSERDHLVRTLERLVTMSSRPPTASRVCPPICADRVGAASAEFHTLIDRLQRPGPVSVRGMAHLRILLGDGGGPIYHRGNSDDLGARLRHVVDTMDPLAS
jgi:hypothetical protein